jgi:hypothetical protein
MVKQDNTSRSDRFSVEERVRELTFDERPSRIGFSPGEERAALDRVFERAFFRIMIFCMTLFRATYYARVLFCVIFGLSDFSTCASSIRFKLSRIFILLSLTERVSVCVRCNSVMSHGQQQYTPGSYEPSKSYQPTSPSYSPLHRQKEAEDQTPPDGMPAEQWKRYRSERSYKDLYLRYELSKNAVIRLQKDAKESEKDRSALIQDLKATKARLAAIEESVKKVVEAAAAAETALKIREWRCAAILNSK